MQRMGGPSAITIQQYDVLQKWLGKKYLNHGNNMAHTLALVFNQLNKERDKIVFTENGRSLNLFFSRGLYFSKRCATLYTNQKNVTYKTRSSKDLQLYISPAIYLYHRNPIEIMIKEKKGVLYDKEIPSYDHNCDVNTYEYRLADRATLPAPAYIITGRGFGSLRKENRIDYGKYATLVANFFPETILIHTPHISFGTCKKKNQTGNGKRPLTGKRILEILYNLEQGRYDKYKQQI
jgi:hypothetical protein